MSGKNDNKTHPPLSTSPDVDSRNRWWRWRWRRWCVYVEERGGRGGVHGEGEISCSVIFGVGERGHYQWRRTLQFYLRCRHDTGSLETMESTFQGGNWSRPQLVPVGAYKWLLLELGIVSDLRACTGTGRGGCTASGNKCHPRVILSSVQ